MRISRESSKPTTFEYAGSLRPIGGWTFDAAVFTSCYACLQLTLALVQVRQESSVLATDDMTEGLLQATRAFMSCVPRPHEQLVRPAAAIVRSLEAPASLSIAATSLLGWTRHRSIHVASIVV